MLKDLKKNLQEKAINKITGINKGDAREATPDEIREMWEVFYSQTPEGRRAGLAIIKAFFGECVPPEIIKEMEKRIDEKGFI